jgi:hypothetical protein
MGKKLAKNINEAGIKFSMKNQEEQPYGGSTWSNAKGNLITYYVLVGVSIDDSEGINPKQFKGYERYNSYTQSYAKILSMYPKDGGKKYNYIVKGMIGVANERSEEELKFAASNSMIKLLNDLGIYTDYRESEVPCKIIKAGENDGGISKEMRPRGKAFTESKNMNGKNTIRLTESYLKKVIAESVKNILKESPNFWNGNGMGYGMELHNRKQARSFPMRQEDHDANDARIAELEMGGIRGMIAKVYRIYDRYQYLANQNSMTHRLDDERFIDLEETMKNLKNEACNILTKLNRHRSNDERVANMFADSKLASWIREFQLDIKGDDVSYSTDKKKFELANGVRELIISKKITPINAVIKLKKIGFSKEDAYEIVNVTLQMMRGER